MKQVRIRNVHIINNYNSSTGMVQEDKMLPFMEQKSGESEEGFLNRIQSATDELILEAKMETKFNVKVSRNSYGHVEKIEKCKLKTSPRSKVKRLSKNKRDKLKRGNIQEEKAEVKYEQIKFGEVVHKPPSLKRLPRGAEGHNSRGKTLLLNSLLGEQRSTPKEKVSMSMKQKAEQQRKEVVAAYRQLKAQRSKHI